MEAGQERAAQEARWAEEDTANPMDLPKAWGCREGIPGTQPGLDRMRRSDYSEWSGNLVTVGQERSEGRRGEKAQSILRGDNKEYKRPVGL